MNRIEEGDMNRLISPLVRFWNDRRGAIAAEFGIVTPILIAMILGTFEGTRYVLLHQKLDRMAVTTSDLTAQGETISAAQLTDILAAAPLVAEPFTIGANGVVIVSSLYREYGTSTVQVAWQRRGAGTLNSVSRFGVQGATVPQPLPSGFTLREGDSAIVSEVFYDFKSLLAPNLVPSSLLYHSALFRPRRGTLEVILP
jgi:Flp pilus assembly protein TadG